MVQGSWIFWRGIFHRIVKATPVREDLRNPRGVPLQLSGAPPYPTLFAVVDPEESFEVDVSTTKP